MSKQIHNEVTGALRAARFDARKVMPYTREIRDGYQVSAITNKTAGVLVGTRYPVDQVAAALIAAGFSVSQRANAARDALFVSVA